MFIYNRSWPLVSHHCISFSNTCIQTRAHTQTKLTTVYDYCICSASKYQWIRSNHKAKCLVTVRLNSKSIAKEQISSSSFWPVEVFISLILTFFGWCWINPSIREVQFFLRNRSFYAIYFLFRWIEFCAMESNYSILWVPFTFKTIACEIKSRIRWLNQICRVTHNFGISSWKSENAEIGRDREKKKKSFFTVNEKAIVWMLIKTIASFQLWNISIFLS